MHDYFAAWLRGANVQLINEVARSRWAAVEALVAWATDSGKAARLSSCAVAVASIGDEQRREIAQVLQGGDASFAMVENDAELQVLAASAAVQLFEEEDAAADAAALAVATGAYGGREPEGTPELRLLAHNYLNQRAVSVRARVATPREPSFTPGQGRELGRLSKAVSEAVLQDTQQGGVSMTTAEALEKVISSFTTHFRRVAAAEFAASTRLIQDHAALSEENNILWWLISGYSRDLDKPRAQASLAELTLPAARELANLTTSGVPPAASMEYLRQALSFAKGKAPQSLTIEAAIEGTTPQWRPLATAVKPPEGTDRLFPILAGLRAQAASPSGSDWGHALRDQTGLAADFADRPEQIGLHFLNELSLARCLANSESGQA